MRSFRQFILEWEGHQLDLPMRLPHIMVHIGKTEMHPEDLEHQAKHRFGRQYSKSSHEDYKDDSESNFNRHLRNGFNGNHIEVPDDHTESQINRMDHNTNVELKHPLRSFRGYTNSFPIHHLDVGDEFTDHGYTGTSLSKKTAQQFSSTSSVHPGHHAIAMIHSPAGTKGHLLDHPDFPDTSNHSESEFTLHRGTTFQVHAHETHHDRETGERYHIIHLHVTGQHAHDVYPAESEHEHEPDEDDDWEHHHEDPED